MDSEQKIDTFKFELDLIKNEKIKENLKICIINLPDYFFKVAASSTGKYHPMFSLGDGGLVRHTKFAVQIANELFKLEMFQPLLSDKDYIISALILHDGLKSGYQKSDYTVHDHPMLIRNFIAMKVDDKIFVDKISELVESHMGQWTDGFYNEKIKKWNTSSGSKVTLPKPISKVQNFVHLCDYLASRKMYNFYYITFIIKSIKDNFTTKLSGLVEDGQGKAEIMSVFDKSIEEFLLNVG